MTKSFTRRIIALSLVISYIVYTGAEMYLGVKVPNEFALLVVSASSYYFGRSTALDKSSVE